MTVRYRHEASGWVMSVMFMENTQSRLCGEDAHSVKFQNENVWTPNGNLRSSQNDRV